MDPSAVNSTMQSLAFGEAMKAAAEDYKKEMLVAGEASKHAAHTAMNVRDFVDDPELKKLHAERLEQLKEEYEKRSEESNLFANGHGQLREITEGDFLAVVTKTQWVVCHFFHQDFQRCKILDRHLETLARKHIKTRFIKIDATAAPFFTEKLNVHVLPCLIYFIKGVATGRFIGFAELSGKDDFQTSSLEQKLVEADVIEQVKKETDGGASSRIRRGCMYGKIDSEDESSDFDD